MRQLISCDEAVESDFQHTKPCSDCPFSRQSLKGWLGNMTVQEWLLAVHGEAKIDCHVITNQQCAGAAIYRANVCKLPRDPNTLRLCSDRKNVFLSFIEFREHHEIR